MRDFSKDLKLLALNTATLGHNLEGHGAGWSPEKIIDVCLERGFGAIAFWRREIGKRAIQVGNYAKANGLDVCGLCRSPFLVGPLAPVTRKEVIDDFKASIEMAYDLNAFCLTVCVGGVIEGTHGIEESLREVSFILSEVVDFAQDAGIKLALEPLHPVYGGNRSCLVTVRDAVNVCHQINHPALNITIDVYHVWWDTSLEVELKRAGSELIAGYQVCDWLADTQDVLLDRGMMGDGVADLKYLRKIVEGVGYTGYCEVEIFSANDWWKREPSQVLDICANRFQTVC